MNLGTANAPVCELESAHANITSKTATLRDRIDELRKRIVHITVNRPVTDQAATGSQAARIGRCSELEALYTHSEQLSALIVQMEQLIESIDI